MVMGSAMGVENQNKVTWRRMFRLPSSGDSNHEYHQLLIKNPLDRCRTLALGSPGKCQQPRLTVARAR